MATTYSQSDLDNINNALAKGYKKVRLNGREVEYQSALQMLKVRDVIQGQINASAEQSGTRAKRPRSFRARCSKGLSGAGDY